MDPKCPLEEMFSSINLTDFTINNNFEVLSRCEICYNFQDCDLVNILNADFKGTSLSEMLDSFPCIKVLYYSNDTISLSN